MQGMQIADTPSLSSALFLLHAKQHLSILDALTLIISGYARRYFVLKPDGVLVYSTSPGSNPRDSIPLRLATITSSERAHQITVDSGTKTFHIRCLTPADFERWMGAFK